MAPTTLTDFSVQRANMESGTLHWFLDDFIRKRCQTLQHLNLSWNKMKSADLVKLSKIEGLKLRHVSLPEFSEVDEGDLPGLPEFQSVISFSNNQRTIVDLDLTCVLDLNDATLVTVCETLPQIEGLTFMFQGIIDKSLSMIFQLKRLQRLDLSDAHCITTDSFLEALDGFWCHGLKSLVLSCTNINDEVVSRLLPLVVNLQELSLYLCEHITDLTIFDISRWLTSLKVLDFYRLSNISNDGLLGRAKESAGTIPPVPLSNIKGLEVLRLSGCERLTEDGLVEAIRFEQLVELELTGSTEIKSGRDALVKGNPKLRTLRPVQ